MVGVGTVDGIAGVTRSAGFDAFYRREHDHLYRALALTLRDADLAADAVDEGMVRAYQSWWKVGAYDSPAGWVYRVALNWAISRRRRLVRSVSVARVADAPGATDTHVDDDLADAVSTLPPKIRAVIVLRFHLDWSVEQIASALRIPAGTVKSRVHRGLAALRAELQEVDRDA